MNRLTRQISLVLLSSSLVLHGCERPVAQPPRVRQEPIPGRTGAPQGSGNGQLLAERSPEEEKEEEKKAEEQAAASGQTGTTSSGHSTTPYHGGHIVPVPIPGGAFGGSPGVQSPPGTSSHSGVSSSSPSRSSSHPSTGSSVRGGFGSSAHGSSS